MILCLNPLLFKALLFKFLDLLKFNVVSSADKLIILDYDYDYVYDYTWRAVTKNVDI